MNRRLLLVVAAAAAAFGLAWLLDASHGPVDCSTLSEQAAFMEGCP